MSRVRAQRKIELLCFPRVSGDEPIAGTKIGNLSEFSPRERG